jgi:6-phosphogluconate dehydrogenase
MDTQRTLGMVGFGRMGVGLTTRAIAAGFDVIVVDPDAQAPQRSQALGAGSAESLPALVQALPAPRTIWIMVPAGPVTDSVIDELGSLLDPGDAIIDGGNSNYRDDIHHAQRLGEKGIDFLDVGTSGGVWGADRGFSLMIGGPDSQVQALAALWDALAPGVEAASRTPGRTGTPSPAERGWLHCGPSGAGHFVKMVHNGIEYALMAAYAEGLSILQHANAGLDDRQGDSDAETAPLTDPQYYQYELPIADIAEVWRRGSVVGSWLLDLTAAALVEDPSLSGFSGRVSDSGEGRWTAIAAIEEGVPAPVITAALMERFATQGSDLFAGQILSAMRAQFGGHQEKSG